MSNPVEQLPRTALAGTGWREGNSVHLRIYFQDKHGVIRESQYDGSWTGGSAGNVIAKDARLNTPIAVTHWLDNGVHLRVYYLSTSNTLREMCWDGSWYAGGLNAQNVQASSVSQLAAISWLQSGVKINVYYQRDDNVIQEHRWAGNWFSDKTLNKALTGTSLSAIVFGQGGQGIRVYYQDAKLNLLESMWNSGSGWAQGGFHFTGPGYTPLAAVTWGGTPELRVYTVTRDANIVEYAYSGSGWGGPRLIAHSNPGSFLAALDFAPNQPDIRIYYITESDQIKEELWNGSSWAPGSTVPSGSLQ